MYGRNGICNTGSVDVYDCDLLRQLVADRRLDTTHLITHRYPLSRITEAYHVFENRVDNVVKIAIYPD